MLQDKKDVKSRGGVRGTTEPFCSRKASQLPWSDVTAVHMGDSARPEWEAECQAGRVFYRPAQPCPWLFCRTKTAHHTVTNA